MINDKKEELKDDYSLINSNAIANYCRSIEYKFNTEELAVLVFRNKKISIKEKIAKYDDLIKNYSDMEVIERINCKHYDSVKTLIKNEIQRLKKLEKRLMLNEENSICAWAEYNKSTKRKAYNLDKTFKTFDEALKDIQLYIKEFNDTISFTITKKYFDKRKNIHAEYIIKNQKIILNNLVEEENEFLDIDQIFLNIPTPFKRGDILIANNAAVNSVGEEKIFVLDYLCTWRNGLNEYLAKGNCDSSDMIGYGYYFVNENTTEFVIDHQWDYDSFEYYNMELTGKYRILKAISSFIKGEISLELFIHSYDMFKAEFKRNMPEFYTDEGLKLAGMTDKDIFRINHSKK